MRQHYILSPSEVLQFRSHQIFFRMLSKSWLKLRWAVMWCKESNFGCPCLFALLSHLRSWELIEDNQLWAAGTEAPIPEFISINVNFTAPSGGPRRRFQIGASRVAGFYFSRTIITNKLSTRYRLEPEALRRPLALVYNLRFSLNETSSSGEL